MSRSSLRAEMYREIQRHIIKPIAVSRFFIHGPERERIFSELATAWDPTALQHSPIGWFHAASVGELEMLIPVIEKWANSSAGVVVTVFSESAEAPLSKFATALRASGARVLFTGFAPWEGEWKDVLARVSPDFVMTARYEAWPELWMSLGEQGIPLMILGAKARPSLKWAKRACRWMGESLPKLIFCSVRDGDLAELRMEFPEGEFVTTGDPRWERVAKRAAAGSPRARELIQRYGALPRPWGVVGSAWEEDMKQWSPALKEKLVRGTLWIVPHRIDDGFVSSIETVLDGSGVAHARVRAREGAPPEMSDGMSDGVADGVVDGPRCLVVNEMGFLAELYSSADWAYVGGGFSEGVHNTIEPAIYGIPVACGPKRADRFPEIEILESTGQLSKTTNSDEISRWLDKAQSPADEQVRGRWKEAARAQLGASEAVMRELAARVSGWQLRQ